MRKITLAVPNRYTDRYTGEDKVYYNIVGKMLEFDDGNIKVELNMFPGLEIISMPEKPKYGLPKENQEPDIHLHD